MAGVSIRLSFVFAIAFGIASAGCGGPQQIAQTAFQQLQTYAASTPLPGSVISHRAAKPFPRFPESSQPLLYVGDDDSNAADIFPLTGPNQPQLGSISKGMSYPWGLSVDSNDSLYVANSGNGTVTVYSYGSSTPSMTYSQLARPLYALADSTGHVFVSGIKGRGRLFVYNAGTNVPIAHRRLGREADGIAEDAEGNLYVAYREKRGGGSTIKEFGPGLTHEHSLGMAIDQPQGLLVDNSGNIVVVESALEKIEVFPPGATTPSVTVTLSGYGHLAELAWQNSQTTLWVSTEGGYVYSMPYPLTPSTVPTEYESDDAESNGIAVTP
jgi:hypothetical protein